MRERYESHLPQEAIFARLRERTRPWSRMDLWTARNTWFHRQLPDGRIRLVRTGPLRGYVYADLALAPEGSGTRLEVTGGLPRRLYAVDAGVCLLFFADLLLTLYLRGNWIRPLLYAWVPPFSLWMTHRLRGLLPELERRIEDTLLR